MSSEFGETPSKFRLKNYDQRDCKKDREAAKKPANDDEIQQSRNQCQSKKNNRESGKNFGAARSAEIEITVVDADAQQNDFDHAAPAFEPKLQDFLHRSRFALHVHEHNRSLSLRRQR